MSSEAFKAQSSHWHLQNGVQVFLEHANALPLVDIVVVLRTGKTLDPEALEGLSWMTARTVRMGSRRMRRAKLEDRIAQLGARLSVEVDTSFVRFTGTVLKRNVVAFVDLLVQVIFDPALNLADMSWVQREALAALIELRDDDGTLANRHFRRHLFSDHPYGRLATQQSIGTIEHTHLEQMHAQTYLASNVLVGVAGDMSQGEVAKAILPLFRDIPSRVPQRDSVASPTMKKGRRLRLVDKPQRTQTQITVGCLGSYAGDPMYLPLLLGTMAFGGTFTSRLVQEIRVKRGWSYNVGSVLGRDRRKDVWKIAAAPSTQDSVACLSLELELLKKFVDRGVSQDELDFVKSYFTRSYAFDMDTAYKRLWQHLDIELFDLPDDYYIRYLDRIHDVSRKQTNEAIERRLSSDNLSIVLVATAKDLRKALRDIPELMETEIVSYEDET